MLNLKNKLLIKKTNVMKKINFILVLIFVVGNLFATETWDLMDKVMDPWNKDEGLPTNKAWTSYIGNNLKKVPTGYSLTQEEGFVNLTKTHAEATQNSAMINCAALTVASNTAYTFEYKVRINPIDKEAFPDVAGTGGWELNLLSARINNRAPNLYLAYDESNNGYVTLESTFPNAVANRVAVDISEWRVYRFILSEDATKFDLFIDGELIFKDAPTTAMSGTNILRMGSAVERARCNMDIEYAKLGIGDFFSKPRITAVALSHNSHVIGTSSTVTVTANTSLIDNDEILLFSLVDENDIEIIAAIEATVTDNVATTNIEIPEDTPSGQYFVKVAVPDNQIGDVNVAAKTIAYEIEIDTTVGIYSVDYTDLISVSRNIVSQGQTLSVKTVANVVSLSEVTIYSLTGNEVYHKSVSGNAFELQAPTVSGMYILNVRLDNNISKGFKIFVE